MKHRVLLAIACTLPALASCSDADQTYTGRIVRGEVEVVSRLHGETLTTTFTPQRPGFHVYSLGLPAGGVEGLGVPTRVTVGGGARSTGEAVADQPVRLLDYPSLGVRLPVYPDGPVRLTVPVRRTGGSPEVRVTYASCSESLCLAPVRDLRVPVHP